jgi:formylglycine-generating enzyme required for sulfatase activity
MPVRSRSFAAFLAVLFAASFASASERPLPPASGQNPPAETPIQIMPAGIYPLTPEREQALRPKDSFKECDACPEMVVVPRGSFIMGTAVGEVDRAKGEDPLHRVSFARPFAVGRFTISFDEWDACLADGGCGGNKGDDKFGRGRMPAQGISFEAAKSYLAWLSRKVGRTYRLPSESEREYFTRAGTTTPFWFGNTVSAQNANYSASIPYGGGPRGVNSKGPPWWIPTPRTRSDCTRCTAMSGNGPRTASTSATPRTRRPTARRGWRATAPSAWCAAAPGTGPRTNRARATAATPGSAPATVFAWSGR